MEIVLSVTELRVLGCLIEKEALTPDQYPLTLNSLAAACNQKSNRDPVMALDHKAVVRALDGLRYNHNLACQVNTTGSRVGKYKHTLPGKWEFSPQELGILCALFLRGPQTVGELRTHTARSCAFENGNEVEAILQGLTEWGDGPFVMKLPREPGRRERRWVHLFCGDVEVETAAPEPPPEPARVAVHAENERIAALENEVNATRQALDELTQEFSEFKEQFD